MMDPPDCETFSDTEFYDTCKACEAGTTTGDDCRPPEREEEEDEVVDYPELQANCITGMEWGTGAEHTSDDNFGEIQLPVMTTRG